MWGCEGVRTCNSEILAVEGVIVTQLHQVILVSVSLTALLDTLAHSFHVSHNM